MDAKTREALEAVWAHVTRYERLSAEALARPDAEEQDLDQCHVYMAGTLPLLLKPLRALLDAPAEAPLRGEVHAAPHVRPYRADPAGRWEVNATVLSPSREDAERVAAALRDVLARLA